MMPIWINVLHGQVENDIENAQNADRYFLPKLRFFNIESTMFETSYSPVSVYLGRYAFLYDFNCTYKNSKCMFMHLLVLLCCYKY